MFLVPGETGGTEVYARELATAMLLERPDIRLTAFVNSETAEQGDRLWGAEIKTVVLPVRATNRVDWVRGEQLLLPRAAERERCDLVHSLANTGPIHGGFKRVLTVHDLLHRAVPESHFGVRGLGMRVLVPAAARRSDRVIAISQSTANEVTDLLHVKRERVDVVPNGLGAIKRTEPTPEMIVREQFRLGDRQILLSVSTKRAHKNLHRLLEALALAPKERRPVLVLPGYATPHEAELRERAQALAIEDDVRFLGWISEQDLEGLYASASGFIYASLYEGFGLPILEAMVRGVPVACSDIAVLREVAGSAALFFDPEDVVSIAQSIESLLTEPERNSRLAAAGIDQSARFAWEKTANGVAESYETALGRRPRRPAQPSS